MAREDLAYEPQKLIAFDSVHLQLHDSAGFTPDFLRMNSKC